MSAAAPSSARPEPDGEQCVCGGVLQPCITCAQPRCSQCDPYRSEDCLRELEALNAAVAGDRALA